MSNLVVITDLKLVNGNIKSKILKFCKAGVSLVLRAKELEKSEYLNFAREILEICKSYKEQIFIHKFSEVALELGVKNLWLPSNELENFNSNFGEFNKVIASVHSEKEAKKALSLGIKTLCVSHIFKTACKKGLTPKGVKIISEFKKKFGCEIYALGGIDSLNFKECLEAGANKVCVMSGAMRCEDELEFVKKFC